jgi:hypothetical protein
MGCEHAHANGLIRLALGGDHSARPYENHKRLRPCIADALLYCSQLQLSVAAKHHEGYCKTEKVLCGAVLLKLALRFAQGDGGTYHCCLQS